MEIKITYVGKLNGVNGIWCGFKPEGLEVIEDDNESTTDNE